MSGGKSAGIRLLRQVRRSTHKRFGHSSGNLVAARVGLQYPRHAGAARRGDRDRWRAQDRHRAVRHIKGSTELMRDLDPEEARSIIDPALKLMIDAVHRYDGYVVQSTGDGIFARCSAHRSRMKTIRRGAQARRRSGEGRTWAGRGTSVKSRKRCSNLS